LSEIPSQLWRDLLQAKIFSYIQIKKFCYARTFSQRNEIMKPGCGWVLAAVLTFAFGLSSTPLVAKPGTGGNFGLGIIVGDPNAGISMKYWNSQTTAIDGALSWSSDHWLSIHGDYLIHLPRLIQVEQGTLPLYYGLGGFVRSDHFNHAGVRIPVGLAYLLPRLPLEFFLELSANLALVPSTDFFLGLGLGGRYYF
jgi:hypothetical protein